MRAFPSLLALTGVLLGAGGVLLGLYQPGEAPPQGAPAAFDTSASPTVVRTEGAPLEGPWFRPQPVLKVEPPPVEVPPAPPAPPPVRPNTTALAFLGKVVTEDGQTKYFFKERASGLVIGLLPRESKQGWTLSLVDDQGYHLSGPGGLYEVR